jgi:O-glycosyl hydrolase
VKIIFVGVLLLTLASGAFAQSELITLDPSRRAQTIRGWGGHVYPQVNAYLRSDSLFLQRMIYELYTTDMRVRSLWYLLEVENDNLDPDLIHWEAIARGDTGLVHQELLLQQVLHERGVRLYFAAWRFPYWMSGKPHDWRPMPDEKPELPPEMEAEFIESIVAYLLYARDRYGISFEGISIANEPDIGIYISGLTPERLLRLTLALKQRLDREEYTALYYMPDVAAADRIGRVYTYSFFALPGAEDLTCSVSYHTYRRELDVIRFFAEMGGRLDLPVWAMEQSHSHLAVPDRFEWSHALKNAICLHDILVYGNVSLSLYWSYAMSSSGGLGLYIPERKEWAPAYDMLKHFQNHIPEGSQRIHTEPDSTENGLRTVAFLLPDRSTIALVLINTAEAPRGVSLNLKGRPVAIQQIFLSDRTKRHAPLPVDAISEDGAGLTLPPGSVSTVRLKQK